MEVRKIEDADGTLNKIEFVNLGGEDPKADIKAWIQANYPAMTYEEFFDRLEEFRMGICRINMA